MGVKDSILTQELVKRNFEYIDGELYWRYMPHPAKNKHAGWIDASGHRSIGFIGHTFKAHRMIYLYHHGHLPEFIDHIDNNPQNNRIENLREATAIQNSWNQKKRKTNTTGVKGVSWNKKTSKWIARCMINYESHYLGHFESLEKAQKALIDFRTKNQGEFARHE
jgi:hypothetical protein